MAKMLVILKSVAILVITVCVTYSTWLLHRVVEDGKSVSVYGITFEPTLPLAVRVINEPIDVRLREANIISDSTPLRVQTVGPVDSNTFVTITNRQPIRVELTDIPVPVRPVR